MAASASGLAAAAGLAWWLGRGDPADQALAELLGQQLPRPDGSALSLAGFRGQPLIVNFWATWCPPCVREMPEVDRFAAEWAPRGGKVLALAIDRADAVRRFLDRTPVAMPVAVAGYDALPLLGRLGNAGGALPFTLLADAGGRIRRRRLGATSLEELRAWTA